MVLASINRAPLPLAPSQVTTSSRVLLSPGLRVSTSGVIPVFHPSMGRKVSATSRP